MPWSNFPDEIMVDILSSRLPVKSLLRFRCVCKPWLSLFSSPSFIQLHLNHHRTTTLNPNKTTDEDDDDETLILHSRHFESDHRNIYLLKIRNPSLIFKLDHPYPDNQGDMDLIGSVNGLVCLSDVTDGSGLILWNPATKQHRDIPPPRIRFIPNQGGHASIGLCFDSVRNDYKIVRIVWFTMAARPRVELYSVSTDCWREIEVEVPVEVLQSHCDTIVKGEPYWSGCCYPNSCVEVMWFDVGNEVFHKAPPRVCTNGVLVV